MMLLEIIIFTLAGILAGVLAGLLPGIHPNTVFALMLPAVIAAGAAGSYPIIAFIVSISISNTIVNFIPGIFLGAPEADTALSVLPGHQMLLRGEGYAALYMTVCGSLCALLLTVAAMPILIFTIPAIYASMHSYTHILLAAVVFLLLCMERGWMKAWALMMFLVSGIAGAVLLSAQSQEMVLFPALSGLFGIPALMLGVGQKSRIPRQKKVKNVSVRVARGSISGWLSGLLVGLLPGIGSAQAGVLSGAALRGKKKDFMVSLGGISTANILFTFIALYTISKTRSGAAALMQEAGGIQGQPMLFMIIAVALFTCFSSCLITLWIGRRASGALPGIDYGKVNLLVLAVVVILVAAATGLPGVAIAAFTTVIGTACAFLNVKRMYLMGFLMLPTILYFSGFMPVFLSMLP